MLGVSSSGRSRSKSPGRPEPSRSRDARERESSKKSSKSSKKYYSSEEDSESETESESDSGSDRHYSSRRHTSHREEKETKSSKSKSSKYRDDSPPKRSSKAKDESPPRRSSRYKEESPPKSSKKSSKKHYTESESESSSEESEVEVKRKKDRNRKSESEKYAELKYAEARAAEARAKERLKKDEKKVVESKVKESKSSKSSKKLPGKFESDSESEESGSESGSGSSKSGSGSGSESEESIHKSKIKNKVYEEELEKNRELLKKFQLKAAEDKKKAEEYAKETAKIERGRGNSVKIDVNERNALVRLPSNNVQVVPKGALLLAGPTGSRARSSSRNRNVEIDVGYGILEDEVKIQRRTIPHSAPLEAAPKGSSLALGRGGIVHKRSSSRAREVDIDVGYGALSSEVLIQRRGLPHSGPVEIAPKGSLLAVGRGGVPIRPALAVETSTDGISRRLSIAGQGPLAISVSGHAPPGSPLLEGYRGTYQSISPMPSPLLMASAPSLDLDLGGLDIAGVVGPPRFGAQQRVRIYDPARDALALKEAMIHSKPDPEVLIAVLPGLAHENILALRTEYKKYVKVNNKGVNIAKHIKLKVPGNMGKAAYAIALGRWESEAHWANFWYQSGSSRRELLIESLIGRSNSEIVHIKEAFSDKRYNDSLDKCMQTELKQDKFRYAVLTALAAKRMDEHISISASKVQEDTVKLHSALIAKDGGETAMMDIILLRSDSHLREVLKTFEVKYSANFAREMIKKSQNLVGETLMHILNGIINRPVRDALLLKQAMTENSQQRAELLISRLVRYHWEPRHLEKVKIEYAKRYNMSLKDAVSRTAQGEFGDFLVEIVESTNKF